MKSAITAVLILLCHSAFAWSGSGHMVIAAEAYRNLSPELQKRITTILEAHPEYAKWKESYERSGNGIDFATFIFMRSSTWPDEIRRGRGAEKSFDHLHWQKAAAEKYPNGLPKPFSSDPTQWLFNGHPKGEENPLQVAVARLLGYRWPRQTGSSFPDCPALEPDGPRKDPNVNWKKDRGDDPASAPRLKVFNGDRINDHHLTLAEKRATRLLK